MPSGECENCGEPAQLQCGICTEMFFCYTPACYDACHPRPRDRETHLASVTAYGTSSKCAHHSGQELCLVCLNPACGDALICMRCDKCDTHAGHKTVDITDYMKRQRNTLRSHVADMTAQQTGAEEKCREIEALPPTEDRYKDLLLQTHVGHLVMREDVSRSEVVCEEKVARSFLTQALCREGKVCALKTQIAQRGHMIAECEKVLQLGDDQVLRAVTESQAVLSMVSIESERIKTMAEVLCWHLAGAMTFSLNMPVSNVHDALTKKSALAVHVSVHVRGLYGKEHDIELSVHDTVRDLRRKVASAEGLREDCFDMTFRGKPIAEGESLAWLNIAASVVLTQTKKQKCRMYRVGMRVESLVRLEGEKRGQVVPKGMTGVVTALPGPGLDPKAVAEVLINGVRFDALGYMIRPCVPDELACVVDEGGYDTWEGDGSSDVWRCGSWGPWGGYGQGTADDWACVAYEVESEDSRW